MTGLFTEADVAKLRTIGWVRRMIQHEVLGDVSQPDWQLLDDLNSLAAVHKLQYEVYGESGAGDYKGFMNDVRKAARDAQRLSNAFHTFTDRHELLLPMFEVDDELARLGHNIKNNEVKAVKFADGIGSRHDPEFNPLKIAAKKLISLWELDAGEPPTPDQITIHRPAGKCFRHVLQKLQNTHGGVLGESVLPKLCRQARERYKKANLTPKSK
jgi:hypothetical protein